MKRDRRDLLYTPDFLQDLYTPEETYYAEETTHVYEKRQKRPTIYIRDLSKICIHQTRPVTQKRPPTHMKRDRRDLVYTSDLLQDLYTPQKTYYAEETTYVYEKRQKRPIIYIIRDLLQDLYTPEETYYAEDQLCI